MIRNSRSRFEAVNGYSPPQADPQVYLLMPNRFSLL